MKKSNPGAVRRSELGRISTATLGGIKGQVEVAGLFTPQIQLS